MKTLTSILLFIPFFGWTQSADDILSKSIQYHDAQNQWAGLEATFYYTETRPTGADRKTIFELDNGKGIWKLNRNEEELYKVSGDEAAVMKGDKEASRGLMLRNYYLYIWGLPMKLTDESTPEIIVAEKSSVNDQPVNVLRVAYEEDIWYFSFDENTGRMLEYKFYKDEEAGKGELITLEEEVEFNALKFPKKRSWYTLPEMKYLGTDILDKVK